MACSIPALTAVVNDIHGEDVLADFGEPAA